LTVNGACPDLERNENATPVLLLTPVRELAELPRPRMSEPPFAA
jgi:hypothetical protein